MSDKPTDIREGAVETIREYLHHNGLFAAEAMVSAQSTRIKELEENLRDLSRQIANNLTNIDDHSLSKGPE